MKREWQSPELYCEEFVANQRIASCGTNVNVVGAADWECVNYELQTSCNEDNSQHNNLLKPLDDLKLFTSTPTCGTIATSEEEVYSWLDKYAAQCGFSKVTIKVNGVDREMYARNPSGNHVIDISGIKFYDDPFKS